MPGSFTTSALALRAVFKFDSTSGPVLDNPIENTNGGIFASSSAVYERWSAERKIRSKNTSPFFFMRSRYSGVYGHPNAAELTYYGLYALQHRGQESAGIVTSDGKVPHP